MNRKLLVIIALLALGAIALYRYRGFEFDWRVFFSSFRNVRVGWLIASIGTTFVTYWIRAIRWQILLAPLKKIAMRPLLGATLVGFSAIYVLGRPGELIRPVWINRREGVSLSASIATILVERFLDSLMLVLTFALTLILVELPGEANAAGALETMKSVAWVLVFTSVGVMIGMYFFRSNIDRIVGVIPFKRIGSLLHSFAQGLTFLQRGNSFAVTLFWSASLWLTIALQFWFMMMGMRLDFSLPASTLVMVGAAIGSIAQIPGVGGGFQAGVVFCLGTFFAVATEQAVAASLIAWVFSYAPTVLIAALYMLLAGLSLKDLRGLETT